MRRGVVAVVLLVALAACEGGSEPPDPASTVAEQTPAPSPSVSRAAPSFDCPNQEDAVTASELRTGGTLEGPVLDGEGDATVHLAIDPEGDDPCRAFLIVETAAGEPLSAPVFQDGVLDGAPRLGSLAEIDERPGAEIVVYMVAGASTEFVAVFSAGGGTLERMTIDGEDPYGDLFPSGGSVGHLEASNCVPGSEAGTILMTAATPQGDGYRVVRRTYSSRDGVFFETTKDIQIVGDPQDLEMFHEFFGSPFGGCAAST